MSDAPLAELKAFGEAIKVLAVFVESGDDEMNLSAELGRDLFEGFVNMSAVLNDALEQNAAAVEQLAEAKKKGRKFWTPE